MADFAFTRQDETKVTDTTKTVPLTCHGHSRPITHISFSSLLAPSSTTPANSTASPTSPPATQQYYMITACKDNNPMLRDGITGDWIGTFIGHKGAIWSARLSADATLAATGSADFSAKVWDTFTGECVATLSHNHIVRTVAFGAGESGKATLATGGMEKKVRVWDLTRAGAAAGSNGTAAVTNGANGGEFYEVCPGDHTGAIKSLVWGPDPNVLLSAADDKTLRWYDIRSPKLVGTYALAAAPTSCELSASLTGGAGGIVSVAAGKNIYFLDATKPGQLLKHIETEKEVASVAVNGAAVSAASNGVANGATSNGAGPRRFVTGCPSDTWVHVWDWDSEVELETGKGHHGPVWTTAFSPDGGMYATGSEDGTVKLWKAVSGGYGLWR